MVNIDVIMPQLGETVTEGLVAAWHKKVGDKVSPNEALFDVETEKVATEVPAPVNGVLAQILVPEGKTVKVGAKLAVIQTADTAAASTQAGTAPAATPATSAVAGSVTNKKMLEIEGDRLSPVVRRLLAEHHIDPTAISGSGAQGRIKREDVLAYIARQGTSAPAAPVVSAVKDAGEQIVPLNKIRKRTAAHMTQSWANPHVLQAVEVDFHNVDGVRRGHAEDWKAREKFSLTYLPFIARAVCEAIVQFPHVNARLEGDHLVVSRRINLGIAVDLGFEGLIVPVVKNAQQKSLRELARHIQQLAENARHDRLKPDDLTEGTYTLSNSGAFGTLITAPIINAPQVAILSTDGVHKKPVVVTAPGGDAIAIRPVGVLAQSFDHRAFDGAYSAAFLRRVKEIVEQRDWAAELKA